MKIAIDCRLLSTKVTGIGFYLLNLLDELAKIDKSNEYKLIYLHKRSVFDQVGNPDTHLYKPDSQNFKLSKIYLDVRIFDRLVFKLGLPKMNWLTGKFDILHGPYFYPWSISRGRFIVTVHDLTSFKVPHTVRSGLCQYYQKCHNMSIPKADYIIADSLATKHDIMELFKIPDDRIGVVYLGTNLQSSDFNIQTKLSEGIANPFILCVGTIEPRKNHINLIKAFNTLKEQYKIPHKLVLAGDKGWQHEKVIAEAQDSKYKNDIIITGYLSPEEIKSLYYKADVFAYVSIYEGFGLPILEAMAAGRPIVYSKNTSMIEVAGDIGIGVDAYDIESIADGIYKFIDNEQLAKSESVKGLKRASQFTWEKTAIETLEVYKKVAD